MSVVISVVIGYVLDMLIGTPKILKKGKLLILKGLKNLYSKISDKLAMVITIIFIVFSGLIVYGIIYCVVSWKIGFLLIPITILKEGFLCKYKT